jgi:hypothetical protein
VNGLGLTGGRNRTFDHVADKHLGHRQIDCREHPGQHPILLDTKKMTGRQSSLLIAAQPVPDNHQPNLLGAAADDWIDPLFMKVTGVAGDHFLANFAKRHRQWLGGGNFCDGDRMSTDFHRMTPNFFGRSDRCQVLLGRLRCALEECLSILVQRVRIYTYDRMVPEQRLQSSQKCPSIFSHHSP